MRDSSEFADFALYTCTYG